MRNYISFIALALALSLAACGTDDDNTVAGGDSTTIGVTPGTPIEITPADATGTVKQNLTRHIDELDVTLSFLETSSVLDNLLGLFSSEDEEEEPRPSGFDDPSEPSEPSGPSEDENSDEEIEIELDELRDGLIELIDEQLMVDDTAEVSEDGLSIVYTLTAEHFCKSEEETPEGETFNTVDEECAESLQETPLRIQAVSYGDGKVDLTLLVGTDRIDALVLQIHDDLIAVHIDLAKVKTILELITGDDEDALELPETMSGRIGFEIKREAEKRFTARVAIVEEIRVESTGDNPMALRIGQTPALGSLTFDGNTEAIGGQLGLGEVELTVKWQDVVNLLASDEGETAFECTQNPDGSEDCREVQEEAEEPPTVEGNFNVFLAGITGAIEFTADDDRIALTGLGLGATTTKVTVNGNDILSVDVNQDAGRVFDFTIEPTADDNIRFIVTPGLELAVTFAMRHISDAFEDLPEFMLSESLGVRLDGAAAPSIESIGGEDDKEMQVSAGQLTLWSSNLDADIVVGEGMCMGSEESTVHSRDEIDSEGGDGPTEDPASEDEDEGHEVFGNMEAMACGE
jgi:hypothetical protein